MQLKDLFISIYVKKKTKQQTKQWTDSNGLYTALSDMYAFKVLSVCPNVEHPSAGNVLLKYNISRNSPSFNQCLLEKYKVQMTKLSQKTKYISCNIISQHLSVCTYRCFFLNYCFQMISRDRIFVETNRADQYIQRKRQTSPKQDSFVW